MSLKNVLITVADDVLAEIKTLIAKGEGAVAGVAAAAEPVVVSDVQATVAKLKQLPIGTTVANVISSLSTQPQPGTTKFEQVVGYIKPLLTQSEDIVREFVQSVFNDVEAIAVSAAKKL